MRSMIDLPTDPPEMREPDAPQRSPTLCSLVSDPAVKGLGGECVRSFVSPSLGVGRVERHPCWYGRWYGTSVGSTTESTRSETGSPE